MTLDQALRLARTLIDIGHSVDQAVANSAIPDDLRPQVLERLNLERLLVVRDPTMVEDADRQHTVWLPSADRASWNYWPRLRRYLLSCRGWTDAAVRSVDNASDKILEAMENPHSTERFRTLGLVVGYVQSGKTANYTALVAKAVDCGYRLVIVLTGIDNALRLQTQRRLDAELTGRGGSVPVGVGLMEQIPSELEWSTFTKPELTGDFNAGNANAAALRGGAPILLVIKKNSTVLQRLQEWLDTTNRETSRRIPCLVIDDEADLASVNTGGNRLPRSSQLDEDDDDDDAAVPEDLRDDSPPNAINLRIRTLLNRFDRVAYVAYTATPFANVLIDHEAIDREGGQDLYPRSFVAALPQPDGYCGAERIFGSTENDREGMDIIREVPDGEIGCLLPRNRAERDGFQATLPDSLSAAMDDFLLAGAARAQRGDGEKPVTMLIHGSFYQAIQSQVTALVSDAIQDLRDEWRYGRDNGLIQRLRERWESDFRTVTRAEAPPAVDVPFDLIAPHIGDFLERLVVRQLNYASADQADYEREPSLKVVVIGGNRLSRGLTLEGLVTSYFIRRANTYDALMQMGRWFGFREGYVDLTRIYTTATLEQWFRDLAAVEQELRADIARYEEERLTPLDLGVRIRAHPSMMVTSPLKMRSAVTINVSLAGQLQQTITFPFEDPGWFSHNVVTTRAFLSGLGPPTEVAPGRPLWRGVPAARVLEYLEEYRMDPAATRMQTPLLLKYIRHQLAVGELTEWIVGVMGLIDPDPELGRIDLGIESQEAIGLIERTRLVRQNSLKAITSPTDQEIGLTEAERERLRELAASLPDPLKSRWVRRVRDPRQGVLLVYPISRRSGWTKRGARDGRCPIFDESAAADDVIGIAVVFPESRSAATVEYVVGTVPTQAE